MTKLIRNLVVIAALIFVAALTLAQEPSPNDPTVSEDANACFAGGTMEGKCALDANGDGIVDDFEVSWAWECGWYLIRLEAGIFNEIPARCDSLIPRKLCFNNLESSFLYVGPPNSIGNAVFYETLDCTGEAFYSDSSPLIFADSEAEAFALCSALGTVAFLQQLIDLGYNTPANYWGCTVGPITRQSRGPWGVR